MMQKGSIIDMLSESSYERPHVENLLKYRKSILAGPQMSGRTSILFEVNNFELLDSSNQASFTGVLMGIPSFLQGNNGLSGHKGLLEGKFSQQMGTLYNLK